MAQGMSVLGGGDDGPYFAHVLSCRACLAALDAHAPRVCPEGVRLHHAWIFGTGEDWAVIAAAHGSMYRHDQEPPLRRTFHDAWLEADRWIGIADTVGGDALIVHLVTGDCYDSRERFVGDVSRYLNDPDGRQEGRP